MEVYFIIYNSDSTQTHFKLVNDDPVTLGRNEDLCHIHVNDNIVSSKHCMFYLKNLAVFVKDMNSKNGVSIDGIQITRQRIYIGDEIQIGNTTIHFDVDKMDTQTIEACTFTGTNRAREISMTLDVDSTKTMTIAALDPVLQAALKKRTPSSSQREIQIQKAQPRATANKFSYKPIKRIDKVKQVSRFYLSLLSFIASIIDIAITLSICFLFIELSREFHLGIKQPSNINYLNFILGSKMFNITITSIVISLALHFINRSRKSGSIGAKLSGLSQYSTN